MFDWESNYSNKEHLSNSIEYLYFLANASLTLRVVKYLRQMSQLPVKFVTVIHQINGWAILVKMSFPLTPQQNGDLRAFLNELGIPYQPPMRVKMALGCLEAGEPTLDVMRRYQVIIVSHGSPECSKIEDFCQELKSGLGYCPETLV